VKKEANHEGMTDDDAPQEGRGDPAKSQNNKNVADGDTTAADMAGHGRTWQYSFYKQESSRLLTLISA